jgi:hypothetical protein
MSDPALMGMPLFSRSYREAIELSFGIGQLNTIAGFEIPWIRHMRILGESRPCVGTALYRLRDGTVTPLP